MNILEQLDKAILELESAADGAYDAGLCRLRTIRHYLSSPSPVPSVPSSVMSGARRLGLTRKETMQILDYKSRESIRRLERDGKLVRSTFGKGVRYTHESVASCPCHRARKV
jgi:hypothetical protein